MPVIHRSQALYWLIGGRRLVSVAGAHGKTTSTGMIVTALKALGVDPNFVNGGVIAQLGASSGSGIGRSVRHRGRRVGRHLPALRHLGRAHHEHRPRPPRPLRLRGGVRRRFRAVRRQGPRGRRHLLRRPRGGAGDRAARAPERRHLRRSGCRGCQGHRHRDGRSGVVHAHPWRRLGVGAPRRARCAQRHQRRRRGGRADDPRSRPRAGAARRRGLRGDGASLRAARRRARRERLRRLRAPPDRGRRGALRGAHGRGRWTHHRDPAAAHVLAHPAHVPRVRRGARIPRRPHGDARCLRRARGPGARRHRASS